MKTDTSFSLENDRVNEIESASSIPFLGGCKSPPRKTHPDNAEKIV